MNPGENATPEETKQGFEEKKQLEMAITKDIEQLKNTKIQEMEELIELKSRKEEARVELDRIKQQIEEERAKLDRIQASMTVGSPEPQSTQTTPPLLSPTSGLLRPSIPASIEVEKVCRPAPRLQHSASVPAAGHQQQEGNGWAAGAAANFQTNFSAFLPVPTTSSGDKRSHQQMVGPLLEQELLRPAGYHPTTGKRPGHSQPPASKAFRSASNPSAEENESLTRSSSSPGQHHRLPPRMRGGVFQRAPWSSLVNGASQVLDPFIPTPVVGIERFASNRQEEQQANRMSRQTQKNVQYAVNSFLGKAANGTLSATEQPIAAALGLGLHPAQKYFQVISWNCNFPFSMFTIFFSATLPHNFRDKRRCCGKLIFYSI